MPSDKIGDPLADAAASGRLGQKKLTTTEEQSTSGRPKQSGEGEQEGGRVKRTFMLTPARAKWLKIQAAIESREMSDIVDEALMRYEQLHPRT